MAVAQDEPVAAVALPPSASSTRTRRTGERDSADAAAPRTAQGHAERRWLSPVRLVDGLSSERNAPGDAFLATLDKELVVDGFAIAERGARVEGRVVASATGRLYLC